MLEVLEFLNLILSSIFSSSSGGIWGWESWDGDPFQLDLSIHVFLFVKISDQYDIKSFILEKDLEELCSL